MKHDEHPMKRNGNAADEDLRPPENEKALSDTCIHRHRKGLSIFKRCCPSAPQHLATNKGISIIQMNRTEASDN